MEKFLSSIYVRRELDRQTDRQAELFSQGDTTTDADGDSRKDSEECSEGGRKATKKVKITKTVAVRPLRDQTKAGVLAVVRRMLARNMENKVLGTQVESNVNHNSAIGAADCEPIIGEIVPINSAAGNTSTQRMGDRISPKSLVVRGTVTLPPDGVTTNSTPVYVRIIIAAQKSIKVGSQVLGGAVDTNRLLRPAFGGVGADQVPLRVRLLILITLLIVICFTFIWTRLLSLVLLRRVVLSRTRLLHFVGLISSRSFRLL